MKRLAVLFLPGCLDYGLSTAVLDEAAGVDTGSAPDPDRTPADFADTADTAAPEPTCAEADLGDWRWSGGPVFSEAADPTDSSGRPWYDTDYQETDYTALSLPDSSIPVGTDRVYRASVQLSGVPVNLSLNLQSDDGLRVYVNGVDVGQWGGGWQEEGCVNDDAECLETTTVAPIDVTALLVTGENTVAARVSNSIVNSYFSITPECID
jgi:hypothetical protein